jgi:hypothetical protein
MNIHEKNMEDYKLESSIDSSSGFGVKIFVRRPPEVIERIENLSDERVGYEPSPKELATYMFGKECREIYHMLEMQAARLDPKIPERKKKTKGEFQKAFSDAGLNTIFMEEIPNEYFGEDDTWGIGDPWYIVTTSIGHIKVGWRKRVIVLDYERTTIEDFAGKLFPDEDVTMGDRMIHAWGYEKLTEYLKKLSR